MNTNAGQRILVVDPFLPMHDRNAGALRLIRILKMLVADGHEVTFLARCGLDLNNYVRDLTDLGVKVIAGDRQRSAEVGQPRPDDAVVDIGKLLADNDFDTAILSFYECARQYLPLVRKYSPRTHIAIDTVDLHFVREERAAQISGSVDDINNAAATKANELGIYAQADTLIAISKTEEDVLKAALPSTNVVTIFLVHPLKALPLPTFSQRQGLLFIGNFWHRPNAEGLLWFCQQVLPIVRDSLPNVTLDVVGQNPPDFLDLLVNHGVRGLGWVTSTEPYLNAARLSVAPLLHGAGQKGKVAESLSYGVPVVSTAIGAEGLGVTNGHDILVADSPRGFAHAIIKAYGDQALWTMLSDNGRRLIADRFTPEAVIADVRRLVPPSGSASVRFFGVPDWSNLEPLRLALVEYVTTFNGSMVSNFDIGILDGAIDVNDAFAMLVALLTEEGFDPEAIPNVSITPLQRTQLVNLAPDTVWVPLSQTSAPSHLRSTALVSPTSPTG